jgi:hypothetical protein
MRGKVTVQLEWPDCVSGSRNTRPKVRGRVLVAERGPALFGIEAGVPLRASPCPEPKLESRCVFVASPPTEAGIVAAKSPFRLPIAEAVSARRGTPGVPMQVLPPKRFVSPRSYRGAPPTRARPKRCASARHAAWDIDDSSRGVRSPSASEPRRSLRRFASPAPSALRVSHPLSGLSPPGPRGSVSRHIRPWGLVTACRAFPSRSAVTPLDARCSHAVAAGLGSPRASSRAAFAPAFR